MEGVLIRWLLLNKREMVTLTSCKAIFHGSQGFAISCCITDSWDTPNDFRFIAGIYENSYRRRLFGTCTEITEIDLNILTYHLRLFHWFLRCCSLSSSILQPALFDLSMQDNEVSVICHRAEDSSLNANISWFQ